MAKILNQDREPMTVNKLLQRLLYVFIAVAAVALFGYIAENLFGTIIDLLLESSRQMLIQVFLFVYVIFGSAAFVMLFFTRQLHQNIAAAVLFSAAAVWVIIANILSVLPGGIMQGSFRWVALALNILAYGSLFFLFEKKSGTKKTHSASFWGMLVFMVFFSVITVSDALSITIAQCMIFLGQFLMVLFTVLGKAQRRDSLKSSFAINRAERQSSLT